MDLKELATESLEANGYEGLYNEAGCGCTLQDLMPCDCPSDNCEAAYIFRCERCAKQESCEKAIIDGEVAPWVASIGKHYCTPDYRPCQKTDNQPAENGPEFATENGHLPADSSPFALGA